MDISETVFSNTLLTYTKTKLDNLDQFNYLIFETDIYNYIYAQKILLNNADCYLYITYSAELISNAISSLNMLTVLISCIFIVVSFAISWFISNKFSKPIFDMAKSAQKIAKGQYDVDFYTSTQYAEITQLSDALNYARDELKKADKMQKDFIANVTHDLKTPLTMIKAYASMIKEISGNNPEKRNEHAQIIIDESDRLTDLVNDLLKISKIQAGVGETPMTDFNLSEFTQVIVNRFKFLTEMQDYVFETDIEPNLYTKANKEEIGLVIYNLIGNAVNYTGDDKKVSITINRTGANIRLCVKDSGKGIPPEKLDQIWTRYMRASETHKRTVSGTGLGLSIVKNVLVKHNFNFGVISQKEKGSTFFVDFPYIDKPEIKDLDEENPE
jgi:signal transduction histidine kinase